MKSKTDVAAAVCAAGFIVVLAVSAYWDRSIRVLHVFEALPYALAGALCLRQNKLGYAGNIRALQRHDTWPCSGTCFETESGIEKGPRGAGPSFASYAGAML
jgi:hypothetical protein